MKRTVSFLVLAGLIAAVLLQSHTTAALQRERDVLAFAARDAERLARENSELPALRAEGDEVRHLRKANEELHALRNEVTQLRRVQPELAAQRSENERLKMEKAKGFTQPLRLAEMPGYVSNAALAPVGFATPEATVQTSFWALREGDHKRYADCYAPEIRLDMLMSLETQSESRHAESVREGQRMVSAGFRIAAKSIASTNEVMVSIQVAAGGKTLKLLLKRYGEEWKFAQ